MILARLILNKEPLAKIIKVNKIKNCNLLLMNQISQFKPINKSNFLQKEIETKTVFSKKQFNRSKYKNKKKMLNKKQT